MSENKRFCLDLSLNDLILWCKDSGVPTYRADQIYSWLSHGVFDTAEMTNLPNSLKKKFDEDFVCKGMHIEHEFISKIDGTCKLVYSLFDGHIIETVIMRYKTGISVCISSQAGCKMGCKFCASAHAGFGRSLTSGEMLGQIVLSQRHINERIHSVVVMGIGEPFDNYDNLIGFFKLANDENGLNLGARHITVSTCGVVPKLIEFTELGSQINLSVSLHAPNDALRKEIMPIANVYGIKQLVEACKDYAKKTGRRITFEYSLFNGVNDSLAMADELVNLLRGVHCHINLIAANEFDGSPFRRSTIRNVEAFRKQLQAKGMNVTLRREMGTDIMAACGQLRRGIEQKETQND